MFVYRSLCFDPVLGDAKRLVGPIVLDGPPRCDPRIKAPNAPISGAVCPRWPALDEEMVETESIKMYSSPVIFVPGSSGAVHIKPPAAVRIFGARPEVISTDGCGGHCVKGDHTRKVHGESELGVWKSLVLAPRMGPP